MLTESKLQIGDLKSALQQLETALTLSEELGDHSHDADVLGEIADTYADLGDFEQAAQVILQHSPMTCREQAQPGKNTSSNAMLWV